MEKEPESRGPFFLRIHHPFGFFLLGGDPVLAPTCMQAHRHSQHPSTQAHTLAVQLASWHHFWGEDKSLKPPKLSRPAACRARFHQSCCCCWAGGIQRGFGRGMEAPA